MELAIWERLHGDHAYSTVVVVENSPESWPEMRRLVEGVLAMEEALEALR